MIADQRAADTDQTAGTPGGLSDDRSRRLEKWAARALLALGGFSGGAILWAIIVEVMIEKGKIFAGIGILLSMATALLFVFWVYLRSEREKLASTRSNQQQPPPQAEETAKMLSEPSIEMAASVTEHTTARLEEKIDAPIKSLQ